MRQVFTKRNLKSVSSIALSLFAMADVAKAEESLGAPPPLEVYGRLPAVDKISLSPDGDHLALIMRNGLDRNLVNFDIATETPQVRPLGKIKLRNLFWADEDHIVVETSQSAALTGLTEVKQELYNVISLNMKTGKAISLYSTWPDYFPVVASGVGVAHINSKAYILAAGITKAHYVYNLNRFDPETGKATLVDQGGSYTNGWTYDAEGTPLARENYRNDTHTWSLEVNNRGWKNVFSEVNKIDTPDIVGLGRTPQSVVVYFENGDKAHHYYEVGMDGTMTDLIEDKDGGTGLLHDPKTFRLAGYYHTGDWITYDYFDPALKTLPHLVDSAFPDYRTRIVEMATDPKKMVVYSEGADDAGTYYFIDFNTGKNFQIGQAYPDLPAEWIAEKQPITFKASDGLELHGYLTLPPGRTAKDLPLVVLPHGGPQSRDSLGFEWDVNAYASRGYAVLQVNFRGSSGYGDEFVKAAYGEWGHKMQTDLSDGVRYLISKGIVDAKRVCIVGYSYGGYAALAGAAFDPGVYRCAASYAGISDIRSMITSEAQASANQESQTVLYWKRYIGDEARWDDISPDKHAAQVNVPILLIHGRDDTTVDFNQSKLMADALKAAGKPVEFVTLNGEDHWLSASSETRLQMLSTVIGFLLKNNPPN